RHAAAGGPTSIEGERHVALARHQRGMRGAEVEGEARALDEGDRAIVAAIVGEGRVGVEPGEAHQPVGAGGGVGLAARAVPPARPGQAREGNRGRRHARVAVYGVISRRTPRGSISYSSPWMGGRLGYQWMPWRAAGPATGTISCSTRSWMGCAV